MSFCSVAANAAEEVTFSPLADASAETRALVEKALDGYGGAAKIGTVNLLHVVANIVQVEAGGQFRMTIESLSSFPERHLARIRTSQGTMTLALDGPEGYLVPARAAVRGAAIRLTPEERGNLVSYFVSDPFFVLRNRNSSRFMFAAGANETVNGVDCRRLHVYADGMGIVWVVDLASGRIVRTEAGVERSELSEWKESGPISIPGKVTLTRGGKVIGRSEYAAYEVNPRGYDVATQLRRPDLWLMRWKVQPSAGGSAQPPGSTQRSDQAASESGKTAATYRPPVVDASDSSVVIWDPAGSSPQ
jgi:hypothetical protein